MTTRLFAFIDLMVNAIRTVPALAERTEAERVQALQPGDDPWVTVLPLRSRKGELEGDDVAARVATVGLLIRTAGAAPGREAYELLNMAYGALIADAQLGGEVLHLELSDDELKYANADQTLCDLQAEIRITYEHLRGDLSTAPGYA